MSGKNVQFGNVKWIITAVDPPPIWVKCENCGSSFENQTALNAWAAPCENCGHLYANYTYSESELGVSSM
jgi:hypothetical protein